jgi:hypothetical protein
LLFSHENYSQSMLVPCLPPDRVAEADAIGTRGIMVNYGQRGSVQMLSARSATETAPEALTCQGLLWLLSHDRDLFHLPR